MTIKEFESVEALIEHIKGQRETPTWQHVVQHDDYIAFTGMEQFAPFVGKVLLSEYEEDRRLLAESNNILVFAYSELCPEGEMGTINLASVIGIIDNELFHKYLDYARNNTTRLYAIDFIDDFIERMKDTTSAAITDRISTKKMN